MSRRTMIAIGLAMTLGTGLFNGPDHLFAADPTEAEHAEAAFASPQTGFEDAAPGKFRVLQTRLGIWKSISGHVLIDAEHAASGRQCLHLASGNEASGDPASGDPASAVQARVELTLADDIDTTGSMSFRAERWTAREPFSFRIEKRSAGRWTEIFDAGDSIRVGRSFLSVVKVRLEDAGIEALRFSIDSPPEAGILIDDLRIVPAMVQKVLDVAASPLTLPALVGADSTPLVKLDVRAAGEQQPVSVARVRATLEGTTDIDDLASVLLVRDSTVLAEATLVGGQRAVDLTCPQDAGLLADGGNDFYLACKLKAAADVDHRIGLRCREVTLSNGQSFVLDDPGSVTRIGIALRRGGDDGVHTYRIPGLATTNEGTLIAVYDVRWRNGGDLPGDIDVGMSRSIDGGRSWGPMKVIMDMGKDPRWRYDGIGDPAVLVDRETGTVWVVAVWSHGDRGWHGSGPGTTPEATGQLMLVRSDDDGVTWSEPRNITEAVKPTAWSFLLQGPGKGITMRDGTLVFAAQYQDPPESARLPHATILYSKDHGQTWHVGTGAWDDTTEAQVVESEPGVLMLNCRYNRGPKRVVMTTRDLGKTWQQHPTSMRALTEPVACMASLIDVDQELNINGDGWLLFSNPNHSNKRKEMTIKASPDRGMTWPINRQLLLDQGSSAGYSCMSMIDARTVGILYEGSQSQLTFQRISLDAILSGDILTGDAPRTPNLLQKSIP